MVRLSFLLIFCLCFISCEQKTMDGYNDDDYRPLRVSVSQVSCNYLLLFHPIYTA